MRHRAQVRRRAALPVLLVSIVVRAAATCSIGCFARAATPKSCAASKRTLPTGDKSCRCRTSTTANLRRASCFAGPASRRGSTGRHCRTSRRHSTIVPNASGGALDWYPPERHPVLGPFRWSGPNPNPIYFLPVQFDGAFHLRIHVIAFADAGLVETLRIEINDLPATVTVEAGRTGAA